MGQLQRFPTLDSLTKSISPCVQMAMEPGSCRDSESIWEIPVDLLPNIYKLYKLEQYDHRYIANYPGFLSAKAAQSNRPACGLSADVACVRSLFLLGPLLQWNRSRWTDTLKLAVEHRR